MPYYRRWFVPGGTFFFTVNLVRRDARLLTDQVDLLRAAWRDAALRRPFETVAVCVLPDHLHCIWTLPEGDHDYPGRWRRIKSAFSRAMPAGADPDRGRRKGERGIWQRRYWEHLIRDERDLSAHIDYIHFNPVKHGLVREIDDWPYSSWRRWKRESERPWHTPPAELRVGEPG